MKTQQTKPLQRNPDGSYPGAIGSEHQLTAEETRKVRESLSSGPKFVSGIARDVGISMTHPAKISALSRFIDYLENETREVEAVREDTRRGIKKFVGFRLSEHGKTLLEIS